MDTLSRHLLQSKGRKHHSQLRERVHQEIVVTLVSPAINIGAIYGKVAFAKMSTPSRSHSSAMGDKCHFDWRETMEKRQLESERQMQALLQEIRRLREENDVLRIQVSSSGPPQAQRSRGERANSRHNQGAAYLGIAGVTPGMRNERPGE